MCEISFFPKKQNDIFICGFMLQVDEEEIVGIKCFKYKSEIIFFNVFSDRGIGYDPTHKIDSQLRVRVESLEYYCLLGG